MTEREQQSHFRDCTLCERLFLLDEHGKFSRLADDEYISDSCAY